MSQEMPIVLAVDPGRRKCGVAVVSAQGILKRGVIGREDFPGVLRQWVSTFAPTRLLVGGSTGSREVIQEIRNAVELEPHVVDERHTTERARARYFVDHPPRGLWRFVPRGLQVPPVPVDDYAAVVMAEDYLGKGVSG